MIVGLGDVVGRFEFNWLVVWICFCALENYVGRHILDKIRVRPTLTGVCPTLSASISNLT